MSNNTVYILEDLSTIIQRLIDYFRNAQTKITDFNEGSEIRNIFSSFGNEVYALRYLVNYILSMGYVQTAVGDWLDQIGILVNVFRQQAVQATGTLVISTPNTKMTNIDIPAGTLFTCSSDTSLQFESVGDNTLVAGTNTLTINSTAVIGGKDGDVAAGVIDTFINPISDLLVTNPQPFENGEDVEGDDSLRSRILEAGMGSITGTVAWYQMEAQDVDGVHDVATINKPPIPGYDLELLINGTVKPTPASVVAAVQNLFSQPNMEIAGINVYITTPEFITVNVNVTVTLKPGYTWDTVETNLQNDIEALFNGDVTSYNLNYPGLNIDQNLTLLGLELLIANSLGAAYIDFSVTSPVSDIDVAPDQAIILGTVTITQIPTS